MTPAVIIREARADGVMLSLSLRGTIKGTGDGAAVSRWLVVLRERKAEIIETLKSGAADTTTVSRSSIREPSAPMSASDETAIRAWLASIGEGDPVTIAEVISKCQRDTDARDYFTGRAAAEVPKPAPLPDDRRTCSQCRNLRARVCKVGTPGGLVSANKGYRPASDTLHRCAGYLPLEEDTDRRHGRER